MECLSKGVRAYNPNFKVYRTPKFTMPCGGLKPEILKSDVILSDPSVIFCTEHDIDNI